MCFSLLLINLSQKNDQKKTKIDKKRASYNKPAQEWLPTPSPPTPPPHNNEATESPDCLREHTGAILNHSERHLRPKKCTNIWKQMRRCAQPKPLAPSATHTPPATVKTGPPNQVLCMQPRLEMGRNEGGERVWEAWLLNNLYLFNTRQHGPEV